VESSRFANGLDALWDIPLSKRQITTPTEIQRLVIPRVLADENVLFRSATGTGKTYAYLLPVLQNIYVSPERDMPKAIVVAPTLELASQIQKEAEYLIYETNINIHAALLIGGANKERQAAALKKIRPELIIGNTARIIELVRERRLKLHHIRYLILDEADNFTANEQIEMCKTLLSMLPYSRVTLACSATLHAQSEQLLESITGARFIRVETDAHEVIRDYIEHWALWHEGKNKAPAVRELIAAAGIKRALVFAKNSDEVKKVCAELQTHNISARALYSGQKKSERALALKDFREKKCRVLSASDLAARGLDISGISYVISLGAEQNPDIYINRAGRTGRSGRHGICVSIGNESELRRLRKIEQKLRITVYPKILSGGRLLVP
jgi:superfamily II DNA/RNA helicase